MPAGIGYTPQELAALGLSPGGGGGGIPSSPPSVVDAFSEPPGIQDGRGALPVGPPGAVGPDITQLLSSGAIGAEELLQMVAMLAGLGGAPGGAGPGGPLPGGSATQDAFLGGGGEQLPPIV